MSVPRSEPPAGPAPRTDTFIARQAIFDRRKRVHAYELLFRSGPENFFSAKDGDYATARVIYDSLLVFGLDALSAGKPMGVNLTRRMLVEELYSVLPREHVILELIETVKPDEAVVKACKALKKFGYRLALDDFVYSPALDPIIKVADIIKVDFKITKGRERKTMIERFATDTRKLLAEKVEDQKEFTEAHDLGYSYFQGYFFCTPEMLSRRDIPRFKLNYLQFLQELNRPEMNLDRLEGIIRHEMSLSVKLLRFLNSAFFGWRGKIKSIKHALTMLGERPLRKWATVVTLAGMGDDKPSELVLTCLIRARFCELIGIEAGLEDRALDLFLTGVLSGVDALVDRPRLEILTELKVDPEIIKALEGEPTPLGKVYQLVLAYERGNWKELQALQEELRLPESRVPESYRLAVVWAEQIFKP